MVMAWSYAPTDFRQALAIVNTCGWDTDCNSANVGCLMALVVGLEGICRSMDFRTPFGDRIILPTADGTLAATDCLTEARHVARMGRKIMGWEPRSYPHWFDFAAPDASQGFLPERTGRGVQLVQLPSDDSTASAGLSFHYSLPIGGRGRISTPLLPRKQTFGYAIVGTGKLYPGMKVTMTLGKCTAGTGVVSAAMFLKYDLPKEEGSRFYSAVKPLKAGAVLELTVPDMDGLPPMDLGLEIRSEEPAHGTATIAHVDLVASAFHYGVTAERLKELEFAGWITSHDFIRSCFSEDTEAMVYLGKNRDKGYAYTGNRLWGDQSIEARLCFHMADLAGLIARFQGLQRYVSLTRRGDCLVLALENYGETILAEAPCNWPLGEPHLLKLECVGDAISGWLDGKRLLQATCGQLMCGAAGFMFENSLLGFHDLRIDGRCAWPEQSL